MKTSRFHARHNPGNRTSSNAVSWHHYAVVGGITVVGWALALVVMRNYRARVSYWV